MMKRAVTRRPAPLIGDIAYFLSLRPRRKGGNADTLLAGGKVRIETVAES
jgi:hypothetical protein